MKKTILSLAMLALCGSALAGPLDGKINTYNEMRAKKPDTSMRDAQNPPLGAGGPAQFIGGRDARDPRKLPLGVGGWDARNPPLGAGGPAGPAPSKDSWDARNPPLGAGGPAGPAPSKDSRDARNPRKLPLGAGGPAPFTGSRDTQNPP